MAITQRKTSKVSKGQKTAEKILSEATRAFAQNGFEAASLREIASNVGIEVPGLYKYFSSKQSLYDAVLEHNLKPIQTRLKKAIEENDGKNTASLADDIMDIFAGNPSSAALFAQCLNGQAQNPSINAWLEEFLTHGTLIMKRVSMNKLDDRQAALMMMNVFQLCTGYFLTAKISKNQWNIDIQIPSAIEMQKAMIKNFLIASLKA